jgi:hypothetical protein
MNVCRVGVFLVLGTLGCSSMNGPRLASLSAGVNLSGSVNRTAIKSGEPLLFTVTLTNVTADSITLHFSSGCHVLAYVSSLAGIVVMPARGGWVCAAVVTQLTLGPGETQQERFEWAGGSELATELPVIGDTLPAGDYYIYAKLDAREASLSTQRFRIQLQ